MKVSIQVIPVDGLPQAIDQHGHMQIHLTKSTRCHHPGDNSKVERWVGSLIGDPL